MRLPAVLGMPRYHWRLGLVVIAACSFAACSKGDGGPTEPPPPECPDPTPLSLTLPSYFPELPNPSDNPLTVEGVALGRRLFYDPILSADSSLACGGCHLQLLAFGDSRRFSEGIHGDKSRRQAPTIINPAWLLNGVFWDGRVASLEEQASKPVPEPTEMSLPWPDAIARLQAHAEYPDLFCAAFGSSAITMDRVVKAIAQFERTFISANSRFDQWKRGEIAFTRMEQRGYVFFLTEGKGDCFHCHVEPLFAEPLFGTASFHNTGLDSIVVDGGRGEISGNAADMGKFKAPSLRNIMESPPYMHDGRFFSIDDVLAHYNHGFHDGPDTDPLIRKRMLRPAMSAADLDTLKAFLETLTDTDFLNNPNLSNPFEP
jgi:cytochrome c peroxidase